MKKALLCMNLQYFAEPGAAGGSTPPATGQTTDPAAGGTAGQNGGQTAAPAFDYEKLAGIIQGKQTVAEDTVLKNYFQQQGLSKEEMAQAIASFKQQKAASQPDVAQLQAQMQAFQAAAQQAMIEQAATLAAVELGIEVKTIPFVLKMADMSQAVGQDGKVNAEAVKTALNAVLEAVPALKPQTTSPTGFTQVGTGGSPAQQPQNTTTTNNQPVTPSKKWNRWNN